MSLYWLDCYQVSKYLENSTDQRVKSIGRDAIKEYQEKARIYLDEFQVEEVDYLTNFDTYLCIKRFMERK